jgi:hypothetical protein
MKKNPIRLVLILVMAFFCSCAYTYKPIKLEDKREVIAPNGHDAFSIVVRPDSLSIWKQGNNIELDKQCVRKDLQFVQVDVYNHSDSALRLSPTDIEVFSNFELAKVLTFDHYYKKIRQPSLLFLVYGLGTVGISSKGIIFAPEPISASALLLWAGFNVGKSIFSNQKLKRQVEQLDIFHQTIPPGEVTSGLICIESPYSLDVIIRIKKQK